MQTTPNGINFEELEDSPEISGGDDGMAATRMFKVAWNDWPRFVAELKGVPIDTAGQIVAGSGVEFPGYPNLAVSRWRVKGFDGKSPMGDFNGLTDDTNNYPGGATVTAEYATPGLNDGGGEAQISIPEQTYITYEGDFSSQYMTVPNRTWKWSSTGETLSQDVPIGLLRQMSTHNVTWHNVVRPPWSVIDSLSGKINQGTVFGVWQAEQVLFAGARVRSVIQFPPTRNHPGFTLYDLAYTFVKLRDYGWNQFYNPKKHGGTHWQKIEAVDGGENPYETSSNFAALFQYG